MDMQNDRTTTTVGATFEGDSRDPSRRLFSRGDAVVRGSDYIVVGISTRGNFRAAAPEPSPTILIRAAFFRFFEFFQSTAMPRPVYIRRGPAPSPISFLQIYICIS